MNNIRKQYYTERDHPTRAEKDTIWDAIRHRLPEAKDATIPIHWKSFWMGQAAAVLLILATLGLYHLGSGNEDAADRSANDVREVYRSSLMEMARAGQILPTDSSVEKTEATESLIRGLREVDQIIEEIRNDMLLNGSTEAKRHQLRRLYATKLDFVQQIILTEEVPS